MTVKLLLSDVTLIPFAYCCCKSNLFNSILQMIYISTKRKTILKARRKQSKDVWQYFFNLILNTNGMMNLEFGEKSEHWVEGIIIDAHVNILTFCWCIFFWLKQDYDTESTQMLLHINVSTMDSFNRRVIRGTYWLNVNIKTVNESIGNFWWVLNRVLSFKAKGHWWLMIQLIQKWL